MFGVTGHKHVPEVTPRDTVWGYAVSSGLPLQGAACCSHIHGNVLPVGSADDLPRLWAQSVRRTSDSGWVTARRADRSEREQTDQKELGQWLGDSPQSKQIRTRAEGARTAAG
jgi:hypothetical protein